jgi:hypothetical protein
MHNKDKMTLLARDHGQVFPKTFSSFGNPEEQTRAIGPLFAKSSSKAKLPRL